MSEQTKGLNHDSAIAGSAPDSVIDPQGFKIEDLIGRLRAAAGPDRELADDILLACGWLGQSQTSKISGILIPHWKDPQGRDWPTHLRPDPTASIDAALTLLPEGWEWTVNGGPNTTPSAMLCRGGDYHDDQEIDCEGKTAVIALCIAVLRARAAIAKALGTEHA